MVRVFSSVWQDAYRPFQLAGRMRLAGLLVSYTTLACWVQNRKKSRWEGTTLRRDHISLAINAAEPLTLHPRKTARLSVSNN